MLPARAVKLQEFYNNYCPPRYVFKTVRTLIDSIPDKYVQGLDCVVLTNQSGRPRRDRLGTVTSRKRRYQKSGVLGMYHGTHRGSKPWVELYVDNIAAGTPYAWIPMIRYHTFGNTLFHEIGHHAHATVAPEFKEKEDVADDWSKKLGKTFFWKNYWYLRPVRKPLAWLLTAWARHLREST